MFQPQNRAVVAPVTTAVFRLPRAAAGTTAGETFTQYLEEHRCNNPNTIATIGSIVIYLAQDSTSTNNTANACKALFRTGAAAAFLALAARPAQAPSNDDEENILAAHSNLPNVVNWLANLINAAKKSPLTVGNVDGFFNMLGHSGTSASAVVWLINSITPFFPDEISNANFRSVLAPGVWTTYRNARSSTGKIIWDNIDVFRAVGITTAGDAQELAITAAMNSPWDVNLTSAISDRLKAYMCLYLEAAGTPIEGWFQGNRARDSLPAARVRGAKEIFRRFLDVKNNVAGLNNLNAVTDFIADPTITGFW